MQRMDRDHHNHIFSQSSILKKRHSFDVTLLEANTLFLADDRNGRDHSGTDCSKSVPVLLAHSDPIGTTNFLPTTSQYQQSGSLKDDNNNSNSDEEQLNDYQHSPGSFASQDDFVLFRHLHSPQANSNGHPSPSTFLISPSSSLLDNLFPDLSSPL